MSNISNQLCNPTPFEVKIDWHAGICITIPADGHKDLTGQLGIEQMDDFRDGKPGSEEVRQLMDHYGIFLRDHTVSYESQALTSIKASIRSKQALYDGFVNDLRRKRAVQGISENEEALNEVIRQAGFARLFEEIQTLKGRVKFLESALRDVPQVIREQLDPEKTLMFTDPPKVFPTKIALQMFLNDPSNASLKRQYNDFMKSYRKSSKDVEVDTQDNE